MQIIKCFWDGCYVSLLKLNGRLLQNIYQRKCFSQFIDESCASNKIDFYNIIIISYNTIQRHEMIRSNNNNNWDEVVKMRKLKYDSHKSVIDVTYNLHATKLQKWYKYWKYIQDFKTNLHATKLQKWYKYWKPFQYVKTKYSKEFQILTHVFSNKLSFSQKYNYVAELKKMWNEFNKYIPNDSHCHGPEGNRVYLEYIFEYKKHITKSLKHNKDYYLTLHPTTGAWHPEIVACRNDLSYFTRLQNRALNNLYHMLSDGNNYYLYVVNGNFPSSIESIPIRWHQPLMPGKTQDCISKCHTIDDFPIKNAKELVENIIYMFENTYFPYLLYTSIQNRQLLSMKMQASRKKRQEYLNRKRKRRVDAEMAAYERQFGLIFT
jgi:hypothetical protein